jgi:hypothetical protein
VNVKKLLFLIAALLCATAAHAATFTIPKDIQGEWCTEKDSSVYRPCDDLHKGVPFTFKQTGYETSFYKCQIVSGKEFKETVRTRFQVTARCTVNSSKKSWMETIQFIERHLALGIKFITPKACETYPALIDCGYFFYMD